MAMVNGRDFPERDDENLLHDLEKQSSGVCTTVVIFSYPWITAVKKYDLNTDTMKPVCNDHLYNKLDYLWFIQ